MGKNLKYRNYIKWVAFVLYRFGRQDFDFTNLPAHVLYDIMCNFGFVKSKILLIFACSRDCLLYSTKEN